VVAGIGDVKIPGGIQAAAVRSGQAGSGSWTAVATIPSTQHQGDEVGSRVQAPDNVESHPTADDTVGGNVDGVRLGALARRAGHRGL